MQGSSGLFGANSRNVPKSTENGAGAKRERRCDALDRVGRCKAGRDQAKPTAIRNPSRNTQKQPEVEKVAMVAAFAYFLVSEFKLPAWLSHMTPATMNIYIIVDFSPHHHPRGLEPLSPKSQ
ncbi:unnamed protein product [Anisakis simplex]|uniref:Uncharacterized protein n=1 Tax=Anisakis simplex TaxID=6269 RepID=A0A3P6RSI5_ANISI|nr:unnamed protein product [Anisakis simplex]